VEEAPVRLSIDEGVATITLDSPHNRNALSAALVAGLHEALDGAERAKARVIVLTHTPPVFCAGADLKERSAGPTSAAPMADAMRRLMFAAAPTIAAVKGPVRAGGVGIMAACDLVVVASDVTFAFTEVRLGLAPAMISVPILQRVTAADLAAPFLTGEPFDAATAARIGLVTHVADDHASVDATVAAWCAGVLAGAPGAVAATKALLRRVPSLDVDVAFTEMRELSESLFAGEEGAEGMASFLERRPPRWAPRAAS
jgi:enoyl-CoA hydratase/carnithine racemase